MEASEIARVRSFNRTITQRVGALSDEYLTRGRPLGASRVLWEIGRAGSDARSLRARLDLDSGYLSRILRGLEREALIRVASDEVDKRVRRVHLTTAGRAECAVLDRQSDALAASLLTPLNDAQRDRLVDAMAEVERLLTAGLVEVGIADPASPDARHCIASYFAELDVRFDGGFDPGRSIPADDLDLIEPAGLLLVARLHGEPIGCGALKLHRSAPAEIKRMWVASSARGLGVGRRILSELEQHARRHAAPAVRLETNQTLHEAIALYRSAGFAEVPSFNDEPYAHHWFEKSLDPSSGAADT